MIKSANIALTLVSKTSVSSIQPLSVRLLRVEDNRNSKLFSYMGTGKKNELELNTQTQ